MDTNYESYLEYDGMRIHVKIDLPRNLDLTRDKCPLFILQHGFTGSMDETFISEIAKHISSSKMAVLRADLYGHGKSEGEFKHHTILKWENQLTGIIDYALTLPFVSKLILAGHSQGGLVSMQVGAMQKDRLSALVALSPAINIKAASQRGEMFRAKFDPKHIPDEVLIADSPDGGELRALHGNYFRVASLMPIEESIDCFDKPVLIIHGSKDESVPVQCAIDAAEKYRNCSLKIIEGADHSFDGRIGEVAIALDEFLAQFK